MDLPGDDLVTVVAGGVPVVGTVDEQEDVDDISVDGGHRTGARRSKQETAYVRSALGTTACVSTWSHNTAQPPPS